jgi:arginase family enzyme
MADIELVGVPFDGYGREGHQAVAAGVLRRAGLIGTFSPHRVVRDDDLVLPPPDPRRGAPTSLINEPALLAMVDSVGRRASDAIALGRFPFVYRGDCTSLLGTIPAAFDRTGRSALRRRARGHDARWWLHVDLDVLDPAEFGAQGVPGSVDEPGGLTWQALTDLLTAAVGEGGCIGWSLAIYDPDQDPSRSDAARIVQLVADVTDALV